MPTNRGRRRAGAASTVGAGHGSLFGRRHAVLFGAFAPARLCRLLALYGDLGAGVAADDGRRTTVAPLTRSGVRDTAHRLAELAAARHLASPFDPTEAAFVLFPSGVDTRPRRGHRYYLGCAAHLVVDGRGVFTEHAERDRTRVLHRLRIAPGDVVLQRAWSPLGAADPRPYTRFAPEDGGALLLFRARQNLVATACPPSWPGLLTRAELAEARLRDALAAAR